MKMICIVFEEGEDEDILANLKEIGIECYTLFTKVEGKGKETEAFMQTFLTLGHKHFLAVAIHDEQLDSAREILKKVKADQRWAGVREAFG